MADLSALSCVLVVADRERVGELVAALSDLPQIDVLVSSGGDDTIDLFEARRPAVVVLTASLAHGDTRSLIVALRATLPRAEVSIIVIGDDVGPIRTALDALDLAPDRFVTRPLSPKALRFAVTGALEAVRIVRGTATAALGRASQSAIALPVTRGGAVTAGPAVPPIPPLPVTTPIPVPVLRPAAVPTTVHDAPTAAGRAALRARWEALADSIVHGADDGEPMAPSAEPAASPIVIKPRRHAVDVPANDTVVDGWPGAVEVAPPREPTLILRDAGRSPSSPSPSLSPSGPPSRSSSPPGPPRSSAPSLPPPDGVLAEPRTQTGGDVVVAARTSSDELWSEPMPIAALIDREARPRPDRGARANGFGSLDEMDVALDELEDPIDPNSEPFGDPDGDSDDDSDDDPFGDPLDELDETLERDLGPPRPADVHDARADADEPDMEVFGDDDAADAPEPTPAAASEPRDFARELRAKMSMMAQRLFHAGDAPGAADHGPQHDHRTDIDLAEISVPEMDLASFGNEPALASVTQIEARGPRHAAPGARNAHDTHDAPNVRDARDANTSPGSWDTQVRERGLADSGALVRGVSDAAMLLAKMFAQGATGRVGFRRDAVETVVYFDRGRPVFASSNEPRDRMGELLVREGKITSAQYERCQAVVAESGRRMGEILVDLGYLKRRELLPAVRRHVEDLVYSLFAWDRGSYGVTIDAQPSAERIRLSRHPAALILEGIRRKLDRATLERLIGPSSTVIEVPDRERLGGIVQQSDLGAEERAALAAFDGQADLTQVARAAGSHVADVLPLAWGLCVLGLATARRSDADVAEDSPALVGETDLAIDRDRVRARWQLVSDADYFALLGVRRDATAFEIRRAYQSARRDFAADCFPADLRRELARELDDIAHTLDEAFRVLRDDRLRQTYLANLIDQ